MRDSNQVICMICESIELVGVGSQLDRFFSEERRNHGKLSNSISMCWEHHLFTAKIAFLENPSDKLRTKDIFDSRFYISASAN